MQNQNNGNNQNNRPSNNNPNQNQRNNNRPQQHQQKKRHVKNPDPMGNPVAMGRYGMKIIRDIAFGQFNIYNDGDVFRNRNFVLATIREVEDKIADTMVYCQALNTMYMSVGMNDPRVHKLLLHHNKGYQAWMLVHTVLWQIASTGDTGPLLVLANQLPTLKHNM